MPAIRGIVRTRNFIVNFELIYKLVLTRTHCLAFFENQGVPLRKSGDPLPPGGEVSDGDFCEPSTALEMILEKNSNL